MITANQQELSLLSLLSYILAGGGWEEKKNSFSISLLLVNTRGGLRQTDTSQL